jgi:hypothetical protein
VCSRKFLSSEGGGQRRASTGNANLLAAGRPESEVVWQWRFDFWANWGRHTVDTLGVIHRYLADMGGPLHGQRNI